MMSSALIVGRILETSQLPSGIAIENCAVRSDNKRIAKRHFAKSDERRKLGGRHRELMADIAWMGSELIQVSKHKEAVRAIGLKFR
jgi:hypothetical protein